MLPDVIERVLFRVASPVAESLEIGGVAHGAKQQPQPELGCKLVQRTKLVDDAGLDHLSILIREAQCATCIDCPDVLRNVFLAEAMCQQLQFAGWSGANFIQAP